MITIDETHDPARTSWVTSAQEPEGDFPIQNLPLGIVRRPGEGSSGWRVAVAIGQMVVDLRALAQRVGVLGAAPVAAQPSRGAASPDDGLALHGVTDGIEGLHAPDLQAALQAVAADTLNPLMALGRAPARALRRWLSHLLRSEASEPVRALVGACLIPRAEVEHRLPARVGDYTDFYIGIHHATAVGRIFRPDNPLLPNYKWVPIGYHGRASTLLVSGADIRRPQGQLKGPQDEVPRVGPTQRLDFELELGLFIGTGNDLGHPISLDDAEDHLFGVTLFNDWSARDIQPWEYQPLGPFLSKSFASSVSPWVVTMEALAPFRAPLPRPEDDPAPLPYLDGQANRAHGALDIQLAVDLQTAAMRRAGLPPQTISRSSFIEAAYWTPAQLVAHHTVNGCALAPGDLLCTGTLSGPRPEQAGSLLELTQAGRAPMALPGGDTRSFLQDGDRVVLRGWCERGPWRRIGLGTCEGTVRDA